MWQRPSFLWPAHHFDGQDRGDGFAGDGRAYGCRPVCHVCLPEWSCYGSCEGWARLVLQLHLPMSVGFIAAILSVRRSLISTLHTKILRHRMIYHLHIEDSVISVFSNCPSLIYILVSLCHIL